ncbi:MAG: preprotein translocase subunit SecG [Candidatus Moranbacteria bacterium]|nr:preprotein translocase subunit SecG [Candidatus Moranbacteria bacterium]
MKHIVVFQVIVAILLTVSILLQSRGTGLGAGFGGDGGSYYSKRGFERFLLWGSVVLTVLFIVLSGINVFVAQGMQ